MNRQDSMSKNFGSPTKAQIDAQTDAIVDAIAQDKNIPAKYLMGVDHGASTYGPCANRRGAIFLAELGRVQDELNIPAHWRAENLTEQQALRIAGRLRRAHLSGRTPRIEDLNPAIQGPDHELEFKQRSMSQMAGAIKKSERRSRKARRERRK